MARRSTTQETSYVGDGILHMAIEVSKSKWKVRCSAGGQKVVNGELLPNHAGGLEVLLARAKRGLGLEEDSRVVSCYEAGRDAFWIHRFLEKQGIENIVIDAASMKVSRQGRRAKSDGIDVRQQLNDLVRFHRGDDDVWRVVRVPSEEDEDDRRLHRELERLKNERTQHRARIRSLLATQGAEVHGSLMAYLKGLRGKKNWDGRPLPKGLQAEILREHDRLQLVESQIAEIKTEQRKSVRSSATVKLKKVKKLETVRGIGVDSAWLVVMELFGWRTFQNRKQVGGVVGLGGTPFDSGEMVREQGISKTGNHRVRARMVELAWLWLRFQPDSDLTAWFNKRCAAGGKRARRIAIVAVARRLLIQLWHFVEHDVKPNGAIIAKS